MSKVTNIIIATSVSENVADLKIMFTEFNVNGLPYNLVSADDDHLPKAWYGGSKLLEVNLFIGAFNYLNLELLIDFMRKKIKWKSPESVQVIVAEQFDVKFRIIDLFPE